MFEHTGPSAVRARGGPSPLRTGNAPSPEPARTVELRIRRAADARRWLDDLNDHGQHRSS